MESLLASIGVVLLVALIIFIFVNPKMEKYRKYTLILIPFVVFLLLYIFRKKSNSNTNSETSSKIEFEQKVQELKSDLKEVNDIADIKKKCSDEKKEEDLKKIEEVVKISDKSERRRKIAEMVG